MPTISKGDLILVTGASGFLAAHVVRALLKNGYRVRGTVRSKAKGEYLRNLFEGQGEFEYVIAEDITKVGVFDEAVKGVDAVAHTASPFYTANVSDPDELIAPAVKGTSGILQSIKKINPGIKRLVITSSVAAIICAYSYPKPYHYTEKDWNVDAVKQVKEKGKDAKGGDSYQASKTLAERALWDFIEKEKPSWEGVTINPPVILGEVIHECDKPEKLNTSVAGFYDWASGQKKESDLPAQSGNWVNVHNVSDAHVKALTVPEAGGERFIISCGPYSGQDYCDILHKHFPDLPNIPVGKPGTHDEICKGANVFVGKKATEVLGIQYVSLEDTVVEMGKNLRSRYNF